MVVLQQPGGLHGSRNFSGEKIKDFSRSFLKQLPFPELLQQCFSMLESACVIIIIQTINSTYVAGLLLTAQLHSSRSFVIFRL